MTTAMYPGVHVRCAGLPTCRRSTRVWAAAAARPGRVVGAIAAEGGGERRGWGGGGEPEGTRGWQLGLNSGLVLSASFPIGDKYFLLRFDFCRSNRTVGMGAGQNLVQYLKKK